MSEIQSTQGFVFIGAPIVEDQVKYRESEKRCGECNKKLSGYNKMKICHACLYKLKELL